MEGKLNWKKFLLYYVPFALILIVLGQIYKDWVEEHYIAYYVVLVGGAFFADYFARRGGKKQ